MQYAADQYFQYWIDNTADVPWGDPCARLEGGMYTGDVSLANGSCSVGVPAQGFAPSINHYVFDPDQGIVVAFLNMPGPDSHMFHVTNSHGIRYIHTLTICYVNGVWQCPGNPPT